MTTATVVSITHPLPILRIPSPLAAGYSEQRTDSVRHALQYLTTIYIFPRSLNLGRDRDAAGCPVSSVVRDEATLDRTSSVSGSPRKWHGVRADVQ